MSDWTYRCLTCDAVSTPERRLDFATEYWCMACLRAGREPRREQAEDAKDAWRAEYRSVGWPTAS